MIYFSLGTSSPLQNFSQTYISQINNNWVPYGQVFILLLACAALFSRFIR